jgi:protein-disulfide isomerase
VVFSDFQCPFCAELAATLQRLEDSSASSLLIVHRNLPITAIHPFARPAAIAGLCAAKQGVFPAFYEMVFRHQDSLGVSSWSSVAVQAGVRDTVAFAGCLTDPTVLSILEADSLAAAELRIAGTPAMLVHGLLVAGAIPGDSILRLLGAEKGG